MSEHELNSTPCSASLAEMKQTEPKFEMPQWGASITTGEIIAMMLMREGTRDEALDVLSQTLADLGISGEEIAHWQKSPGICHDCNETDNRVRDKWWARARKFSTDPIEMRKSYLKAEKQNEESTATMKCPKCQRTLTHIETRKCCGCGHELNGSPAPACSAEWGWEDFAEHLAKYGVVDPAAVEDGEGYDNNHTLACIEDAWTNMPKQNTQPSDTK